MGESSREGEGCGGMELLVRRLPLRCPPPPALPINKKTGGVVKKFADGGHCSMKSGGEGFKVGKKMGTW